MFKLTLPSKRTLNQMFTLDEKTGKLYYSKTVGNQVAGNLAGTVTEKGYIRVQVEGVKYYAHRIVKAMYDGGHSIPQSKEIDHINGIRYDNRIENLDVVTHSENMKRAHQMSSKKSKKASAKRRK